MKRDHLIIVRGGGDIATGTIARLSGAGFRVLVLEAEHPAAIRRKVAVCEAVYDGRASVEDLTAVRIRDLSDMEQVYEEHCVPLLVDPEGKSIRTLKPDVVVDAILAKKNLGTARDMAPLTIGLGPVLRPGRTWTSWLRPCAGTISGGLSGRDRLFRIPEFPVSSAATPRTGSSMPLRPEGSAPSGRSAIPWRRARSSPGFSRKTHRRTRFRSRHL